MPAGRRNFERPLGMLLPFDIGEINIGSTMLLENILDIDMMRYDAIAGLQKIDSLRQDL